MRIVVSGGGTAGHISPALATCDALKSLDKSVELLYVGQAGGMEAKIVAASGWRFAAIKAGKFRRNHFAGSLAKCLMWDVGAERARCGANGAGVAGALRVLRRFKPDVVFIKGGFVACAGGVGGQAVAHSVCDP
jgi:UDP-N-acetylglucosamine--N-acetylmuramyl-(pentapeptide) pyrophosphoryl-undecaprenol N-acetylglucosamine transferase